MIGWVLLGAMLVWLLAVLAWDEWQQRVVAGWCWRCGCLLPAKAFQHRTGACPAGGAHDRDIDVTREELRRQRVPRPR